MRGQRCDITLHHSQTRQCSDDIYSRQINGMCQTDTKNKNKSFHFD